MQTFYSNGKLLLTGEYVVLDGAKALALPSIYGQSMQVEPIDTNTIHWTSVAIDGNTWFEAIFNLDKTTITTKPNENNDPQVAQRLIEILEAAKTLNPAFLDTKKGCTVVSTLEFATNWGLGSSSTLLNNIAQWAKVDAFALSNATFGGSGYDIACAQNDTAIVYAIENGQPTITPLQFNKAFQDRLFFVHLNRKQDSRKSIKTYQDNKKDTAEIIAKINDITTGIIETNDFETFQNLLETHETLIGQVTNQTPIKERLFSDYLHQVKSLGGWNGDFVMVTGDKEYVHDYFKGKGHDIVLGYGDMIK